MIKGEMLSKMLILAATNHSGQFDKGGKPYIFHPLKVMHYLNTDDEELNCIALGHDLGEDCGITHEMFIAEGMSVRVADSIGKLSKVPGESYEQYKEKVFSSIDAMLVKREDLRTNSDIRRLINGIPTEKDMLRIEKYHRFWTEIDIRLRDLGIIVK